MFTKAEIDKFVELIYKHYYQAEWPQNGNEYWYINSNQETRRSVWVGCKGDLELKTCSNLFHTEEEAQKEAAFLTFERAVRAKAAELNEGWVADWKDGGQAKWQIAHESRMILVDHWFGKTINTVRGSECKSREAAQALLDHFGADKFLAYATGGEL